ncbi:hypothetical protein MASR2M79_25910 [Aminivibrio sp.]
MNSGRRDGLWFFLFLLLVGGLAWGQHYFITEMTVLKSTIRDLRTESMILEQQAKEQMRQIEVYKKAIVSLAEVSARHPL